MRARDEIYADLQALVDELIVGMDDGEEDGETYMATNFVLVIGGVRYGDAADEQGCVYLCPRGGSQANWKTVGLLQSALSRQLQS